MFGPSSALACDPSVVHGVGRVSNPPGPVKEGTSGLGNPLHGFYTDVNAMAEIPRVSVCTTRRLAAQWGRSRPAWPKGRKILRMTFPTKVLTDNLGPIGILQKIRCKNRLPMVLGSRDSRFIHQHRPINMNGRSILSETSRIK